MSTVRAAPAMEPASVAEQLIQQALEWQVTFWSGEVTEHERAAFEHWLTQDAEHARAWSQVQRTGERVRSLGNPASGNALRATGAARQATTRRTLLRAVGLFAGAGAAAYAVRSTPTVQSMLAEHRTGRGERRDLLLPDGTRLVLNTDSAIDLRFTTQAREVQLLAGEVFIATAPDPQRAGGLASRPFTVHTRHGTVQAIGTRFTVQQAEGRSQVSVEQGAVLVRPGLAGVQQRRLEAGQRVWFSETEMDSPLAARADDAAWTRGLLVAERMRLQDFLAELARYRSGLLRCAPAVRDLVVSGVYPLDDTDLALATLAQALPVRIDSLTRYWVTVNAR
ncbi:FecR domain-containing protein [Comamonas composti]|uniref:FecR domain-containing protein n=1 Tax=Comamonas composti TaxID=408558 RepID=UPI0003F867E8|nr:FecR domain-containing protein [Comamonas composti]